MIKLINEIVRIIARMFVRSAWEELRPLISYQCRSFSEHGRKSPPFIIHKLLISGEDHRNGWHYGFDAYAICRAIWRRVIFGRREGASTIEQQLVRVMTNRYEYTIRRKLREILLATLVAKEFEKSTIASIYLDIAYFGWRMNGYVQACHRLGFSPDSLTLDEAAELVARLKYPEPRVVHLERISQIYSRKLHLKRLYAKHLNDSTYDHLGESHEHKTIQVKPLASKNYQLEFST